MVSSAGYRNLYRHRVRISKAKQKTETREANSLSAERLLI